MLCFNKKVCQCQLNFFNMRIIYFVLLIKSTKNIKCLSKKNILNTKFFTQKSILI